MSARQVGCQFKYLMWMSATAAYLCVCVCVCIYFRYVYGAYSCRFTPFVSIILGLLGDIKNGRLLGWGNSQMTKREAFS